MTMEEKTKKKVDVRALVPEDVLGEKVGSVHVAQLDHLKVDNAELGTVHDLDKSLCGDQG